MAVFHYRALNPANAAVVGTIAADSPRQARDLLRLRELRVEDIREDAGTASRSWHLPQLRRRFGAKLTSTIREMSTLLGVGIPLIEAIDVVRQQHEGRFEAALLKLRDQIAAGASLAESMSTQPELFDELTIRMSEVGENAGNLDVVLAQLADFKERSMALKDRVFSALLYPVVVLVVAVAVSLLLMTVVVPMLLDNLIQAGRELPWPTRMLKTGSDTLVGHGWWLAVITAACSAAIVWQANTRNGKRLWHALLLHLPVVGEMTRKQSVARAAMVISVLLRSGIEFLKALEIASRSIKNVLLQDALNQAAAEVGAGREIGLAMQGTTVFSSVVIQVFSVGQQTGRLEEMLERLATDYDRQVATMSSRLASIVEPVLILVLSVFVGFILFATILPILEAGNVL